MANLEPKKMTLSEINGGKQYTNADGLQAETINAVVESGAWVQALVTTDPDTTDANAVGTPSVTIDQSGDTPKFVFKNLKGVKGETGSFATPEATATQLGSGQNPTVTITATGEDTNKKFTFAFGIPKGEKGTSISHRWEGTTLYITSESGTSSTDLKGASGANGSNGANGKTPELAMDGDTLKWRYQGESAWKTIYTFPFYDGSVS